MNWPLKTLISGTIFGNILPCGHVNQWHLLKILRRSYILTAQLPAAHLRTRMEI
jgi:hypothetical protein